MRRHGLALRQAWHVVFVLTWLAHIVGCRVAVAAAIALAGVVVLAIVLAGRRCNMFDVFHVRPHMFI
jgi:hypothetical protein